MQNFKQLKATALMTAPRFEIVYARNFIEIALREAGIPLIVSGGVFYGQCMQTMLTDAIKAGTEVALTVDFDSMFTAYDVRRLINILASHDEIDAICAMQCRRNGDTPLLTIDGETEMICDGRPVKVNTAHFGLTAIDLTKLADVPKPWFWSQPNPEGEWAKNEKIDDDIWFWRQWERAGNSIYVDTDTRIGHLEEMVTTFNDRMEVVHLSPTDWKEQEFPQKRGNLVFVGANRGDKALDRLYAQHENCLLIEPQPDACEVLRQRYPTARVIEAACGSEHGTRGQLNIYNDFGLSSSFGEVTEQAVKHYGNFDLSYKGTLEVEILNLYEICKLYGIDEIRTLVIDAQGCDLAILQTMEPMLRAGAIQFAQAESDSKSFSHYSGTPNNKTDNFRHWLSQFGHYSVSVPEPHLAQPEVIIEKTNDANDKNQNPEIMARA